MSEWKKPAFTELAMNAEIGSYQEDTGGRGNPPIADERAAAGRPAVAFTKTVRVRPFCDEEEEG